MENPAKTALLRIARLPFWLAARKPFVPPRKALILQPCCVGRVMLTTPLLAALSEAFPKARFDWVVSDAARLAVAGNPRITRLISTGAADLRVAGRDEVNKLIAELRREAYDACFIPAYSAALATIAWRARIPQRVGLNLAGHGFAHTVAVSPPKNTTDLARMYLSLAEAAGVDESIIGAAEMEFYPPDSDRTAVIQWLVEELDWLGEAPLVILHPGGRDDARKPHLTRRWPVERFARLGNHLVRNHQANVIVVGGPEDGDLAKEMVGMMSVRVANRAGRISLGELGALSELASLYVGSDIGSTYVAAAAGCPTLVIYGPTDPAVKAPYMVNSRVRTLRRPYEGEFSWAKGVGVEDAAAAADALLQGV